MKKSIAEVKSRQQKIISILKAEKEVKVGGLSELLEVSELTIRRDLDDIAKTGLIIRFYGGARLQEFQRSVNLDFDNKNLVNQAQKRAIAQKINEMIKDDETVFINAGTTTFEIIRTLLSRDLTIVTNNAQAFLIDDPSPKADLISTGGEYNHKNRSFSGPLATEMIKIMYASTCVLGVNGISAESGATTAYYPETMINGELIRHCRGRVIIAADGSKIGNSFSFMTCSLKDVDCIVTDSTANEKELEKIIRLGVKIIKV